MSSELAVNLIDEPRHNKQVVNAADSRQFQQSVRSTLLQHDETRK